MNFKNLFSKTCTITKRHTILYLFLILLFCSHDLYLKMETYFLTPNQEATLQLFNGTFEKSENIITRDRMLDASFVANGVRNAISESEWKDLDSTITQVTFTPNKAGTYVAGVATKARNIELKAADFNDYLKHDGILDMLDYRSKNQLMEEDAIESYQKHVKAIFQVGEQKTDDWKTALGYPIEFIPLSNPYDSYSGGSIALQLLLEGEPLANQLVYANHLSKGHHHDNHDHDHSHDESNIEGHSHTDGQQLRTNNEGVVEVALQEDGIYYIRTIHMVNIEDDEVVTHASKWATLTFEVTHKHDESTHTHDDHTHEDVIPTWIFILGSVLLIGLLFFFFRKK